MVKIYTWLGEDFYDQDPRELVVMYQEAAPLTSTSKLPFPSHQ